MSVRPRHDMNEPNESERPIHDLSIHTGIVTSRLRRFHALSNRFNSSSKDPGFAKRERVHTSIGSEHRPHSHFAKSTTHYDVPDFRTPGPAYSFVIHNCGRKKHEAYAFTTPRSGIRPPVQLQPSSCRKSFSMGHLCDKFGHTEIQSASGRHVSNRSGETHCNPMYVHSSKAVHRAQSFTNPSLPTIEVRNIPLVSSISHNTPEVERLRSARDMFTQYNISRPSGWLSDVEDLSLSGDGNASPRSYCRYCHICSTATWAPTYCSSCGHSLCKRCICEVSSGTPQAHANFSHRPSPTIARDQHISAPRSNLESIQTLHREVTPMHSTSENRNRDRVSTEHCHQPSNLRADRSWQRTNEEHGKESRSSRVSTQGMSHRSNMNEDQSERVGSRPKRSLKENPFILGDRKAMEQETKPDVSCDDAMCRATHVGHYPFRHSVTCSKHKSEQSRGVLELGSASNEPPQAKVSNESDFDATHLPVEDDIVHRHHSAGFHNHHRIARPLSSAGGHIVYGLIDERNKKSIEAAASKASIKPIPYLERLINPKPITQIDSFQRTQVTVSSGHPGHPGCLNDERQQHSSASKVAISASGPRPHNIGKDETTFEAMNTTSGPAAVHSEQREVHNDSNLSWRDNDFPKGQFASTPSWLRNPSKEVADATARLHHVDTKRHETREHDQGDVSDIAVNNWEGHSSSLRYHTGSSQELNRVAAPSPPTALHEERHSSSIGIQDSSSLVTEVPVSPYMVLEKRIDQAPPERKPSPGGPVSVSNRRKLFESGRDHIGMGSSTTKAHNEHGGSSVGKTHSRQAQHQKSTSNARGELTQSLIERWEAQETHLRPDTQSRHAKDTNSRPLQAHLLQQASSKTITPATTQKSDPELERSETQSFIEQSSQPEIATLRPIAPPNHEST
ncbi:hypothetical protein HD806DRAFT_543002 [Xylariaceae sp. AK1471]|nr:hypothetical protein HD806DRAFT_543002 [Xylariaceae sp. AK1471]